MMKIGSHRLPDSMVMGPIIDALGDQHDRERNRQEIDRESPEHVEDARQDDIDDAAEKAGGEADDRREEQRDHGRGAGDQQRVAAAIEQARHDIAALIVGAEEIVAELARSGRSAL